MPKRAKQTRIKQWREAEIRPQEVRDGIADWLVADLLVGDRYIQYQWRGSCEDVHIYQLVQWTDYHCGELRMMWRPLEPTLQRTTILRQRIHQMIERGELTPSPA